MSGIMQVMFFNSGAKDNNFIGLLGASVQTYGTSVSVDTDGNIYVCGYSGSGSDIQLAKYNSSGAIQWQETLNNSGNGYGIAVDSSNNVYVCGISYASGNADIQIVKCNSSGVIQWQRQLGNAGYSDVGYGIAVDSSSNVYVCGSSDLNILIVKYNSSGAIQWQRKLSATNSNAGRSVSVDTSGNVYVCGSSNATGAYLFIIAKYDSSGVIQWQRRFGAGGGSNFGLGVSTDSSGNVYVCGSSDAVSGNQDTIIAKYDSSGVIQWQRRLASSGNDYGYGVSIDSSNNVYVCGIAQGTSAVMVQIVKYDASGVIQWQRQLGNANGNNGYGIAIDTKGHIYVCGNTIPNGSYNNLLIAKLPSDGTLTGTYTVGGYSFTYSASSLTDASTSLTEAAATLTDSASTLTDSASALTATASSLTSSIKIIP